MVIIRINLNFHHFLQGNVQSTNIDDVTLHLSDISTTPVNYQQSVSDHVPVAHIASSEATIYPLTKMTDGYSELDSKNIPETRHTPRNLPSPPQGSTPPRERTHPIEPSPPLVPVVKPHPVEKKPKPADRQVAPVKPQPQDNPIPAVRHDKKHHHDNNNGKHKTHESRNNNEHNRRDDLCKRKNTIELIHSMSKASEVAVVAPQQQQREPKPNIPEPSKPTNNQKTNHVIQAPPMHDQAHLTWNTGGTGLTLADLKKRRQQGHRTCSIDGGLDNKLGTSNGDILDRESNGVPAVSTVTYSPFAQTTMSFEHRKHYKATMDSEIIGTEDSKQGCCVIL